MKILILNLFIALSLQAQTVPGDELAILEKDLDVQIEWTGRDRKVLEEETAKLSQKKAQLEKLQEYEKSRELNKTQTIKDITATIKGLPFGQKLMGRGAFFKCLRNSLEQKGHITQAQCVSEHRPKLTLEEETSVNAWNKVSGKTASEVKAGLELLPTEITRIESNLPSVEARIRYSESREDFYRSSINAAQKTKKELETLPQYSKFTNCDANTPEINLESEVPFPDAKFSGPFVGVPRDNQDGLGTCYANAAKNLLVGLSEGKNIASFTDMALQYKKKNDDVARDGLDAGISCATLRETEKAGFCPQHLSPLESGERDLAGEALFNTEPYRYHAFNINLLKSFLSGMEEFKKGNSKFKDEILAKSQAMIQKIKSNPNIILPFPVVRHAVPEDWKLREFYAVNAAKINKPESEFKAEYKAAYQKFYPKFVKALLEGKDLDQIFEVYKTEMAAFISKYEMEKSMPEFKRVFVFNANSDFKDPNFKKNLKDSLAFLKDTLGMNDKSDESFIEFCSNSANDEMLFLASLQPLIDEMKNSKLNADLLYDKDGKFKSVNDLMQLTVAPSCINSENRQKMDFKFTCNDGYDTITKIKKSEDPFATQVQNFRNRIVLSLVQGYPVGNSFMTGQGSGHINSIVGLRYNPDIKKCELLIRESQNGRSDWHSEERIFERISALTEVRRE